MAKRGSWGRKWGRFQREAWKRARQSFPSTCSGPSQGHGIPTKSYCSGGQKLRFHQMASEGKYLCLSMESSSDSPFPVAAWGWMRPQGKWATLRAYMLRLGGQGRGVGRVGVGGQHQHKYMYMAQTLWSLGAPFIKGLLLCHLQDLQAGSVPSPHFVLSWGCFQAWFWFVTVPQETLTYMTQFLPWQTQRKLDLYWNALVMLASVSPTATSSAKAGPYWGWAHLSPAGELNGHC